MLMQSHYMYVGSKLFMPYLNPFTRYNPLYNRLNRVT